MAGVDRLRHPLWASRRLSGRSVIDVLKTYLSLDRSTIVSLTRDWPKEDVEPVYSGLSIGKWIDLDGDGKYDVLESRPFHQGSSHLGRPAPTHKDDQSIVKERILSRQGQSGRPAMMRSR